MGEIMKAFIKILLFLLVFTTQQVSAGTILGDSQGDLVRFLYFLINGPPASGYPTGFDGPESGLLGLIREVNGPTALGGGLASAGFTTCASIPATGSATMTDSDGTFTMTFGTPLKTIPTGYTGAGGNFDKRVAVAFDGTNFMVTEFNCNTSVGYMRFAEPGGVVATSRNLEVYYDTNVASEAKMELTMFNEPGGFVEYMVAKFQTNSATEFQFWVTRAATQGGTNGFRIAARGDTGTKMANVHMTFENGSYARTETAVLDGGDITIAGGDVQCLDFTSPNNPVAGAGCGSLTLSEGGTTIIDSDGDMSIENTSNVAKMKAAFTAL
jgi:hypothetical protein